VPDVSREFDRYWESASAYPAELLITASPSELAAQQLLLEKTASSEDGRAYAAMAEGLKLVAGLISGRQKLEWVKAELVCDDPAKGLGSIPRRSLVVTGLTRALAGTEHSLDAATAYFVPGRLGVNFLRRLAQSGKTVRVLTNSLASTDVAAVHAGYARYRRRLLRAGVRLFEMKPQAPGRESPAEARERKFPRLGSSRSSWHAKLFLADRRTLFIGSFNFDPRSVYLNCEMGIMIESAALGEQVGRQIDQLVAQSSFEPRIGRLGKLRWLDGASGVLASANEPESSWRQRLMASVFARLPLEWML
jgi:putative cardiolipin synthase